MKTGETQARGNLTICQSELKCTEKGRENAVRLVPTASPAKPQRNNELRNEE